ncbi:MAG: LD-carboxypeptidase [Geminicoccaceae bacterium]|nr:LD-carboxypeptidase [Geminicoccaceae bacterium]
MRDFKPLPAKLEIGDKVRFVSPASPPEREGVYQRARLLESWGLRVDFGRHVFDKLGYLAGSDEDRLADFNGALRDPGIRAIFATRGGKGSYRIADRLDFTAARNDPKHVVGFSDITILHLALLKNSGLPGIHGTFMNSGEGVIEEQSIESLRQAVMTAENVPVHSRAEEATSVLTTGGIAEGRLIGGNLEMISTAAGWALPELSGAILLVEAVNMHIGQLDRQLTMLRKSGCLRGLAGIALGQFTGFRTDGDFTMIDLLRDHLGRLDVPVLGGLPLGHGEQPLSIPTGTMAALDANSGTLTALREQ